MLGLPGQIGRHDLGVGVLVGNDGRLRRPRHHVDADAAKQHALGFGHKTVARSDDDVGRRIGVQAVGQRRDGLNATERQHGVCPAQLHRIQNGRVDAGALVGRRSGHDVGHTRDLRGAHAHDGRCRVGVTTARHIAAGRVDRDQFLTGHQTAHQLDFKLGQ